MISNIPLRSGHRIPQLGLGTYKLTDDDTQSIIEYAIELGFRHIDTAQMYGNEAAVGAAIKASGIPREEFFVTSKLDNGFHEPAIAREEFRKSLSVLGMDYVDMFLIHWPLPHLFGDGYVATWETLIEFAKDGRARTIGVSNFEQEHLEKLIERTELIPAVNQIELHPYFQNRPLVEFCTENGIAVEAWAPLVRGAILNDPVASKIAENHGCTTGQAVLAWHLAKGNIVFPKSAKLSRIKENFESQNVQLTLGEVEELDALDRDQAGRIGYHPNTMKRNDGTPMKINV